MAGKSIKGIIVEIGGDTSGLQKALSKVNSATSSLSKELKGVNSLLKLDPSNTELIAQKQTILTKNIEETSEKLNLLKEIQKQADDAIANGTKIADENYRNLQREIINTQNKLKGLTNDLEQFNKEINVQNSNWTKAGKKVEEYGNKINKVGDKIDNVGNKLSVISAGAIAGGTILTNTAMGLEDAVAKYVSTTNIAENETQKYKDVLESINNAGYGEGYEDIANSMSAVKMQLKDIDATDLKNITEKAIALRDLFGYEVSESVRAVKALMDNFNISADEAFNLLSEGKKQGLDFSNELLDNVNEYSVQFDKLGLSAEDMFNIFKVGADNGAFNLDKIGDAVKEFSIRAIDGSNTTIDGFERIGLNADETAKKIANGGETAKEAFIEVVTRLGNMDDKVSQSIAGVDLFGTMWEDLGPTVISSFNKMDNGISQSSDSMQKSIDELYNTTKKKAEKQLKRLQSLGADFGEEMLPVLEDLIDMAEGFIEKLEGMSDVEKENIVKIGLLVAGLGPFTKIMGNATSIIGGAAKGIGTFSQAIAVATNKTTSNVTSINNLAKAFGALTSPMGIVLAATAGAVGIGLVLSNEQYAYADSINESTKKMNEAIESQRQFRQAQDETLNSTLTETDNVQRLYNELQTLVDKNGKVKEGYEGRVNFILNELNGALGTEYKLNGKVVDSYDEIIKSIDDLIQKKRINAILENEEAKYNEAMDKKTDAYNDMIAKEEELATAKQKVIDAQKLVDDFDYSKGNASLKAYYDNQLKLAKHMQSEAENNLNNSKNLYHTYLDDIATYQNDYEIAMSGNTKKINELINSKTYTYQKSSNDIGEVINHNIQQVQYEVEQYKLSREEDLRNQDETNAQKNQKQIEAGEKQLETLAQQLVNMTSTTEKLTPQQIEAWRNLATGSYDIYKEKINNMSPEMQAEIQDITGIIVNDNTVKKATTELAKDAEEGFNNNVDGAKWGLDLAKEMSNSLTGIQSRSWIVDAAATVAGWIADYLHFTVPDKGPLSDMDKSMPDMIDLMSEGIYNSKGKLLNATNELAQDLKDKLMLNNNMNLSNLEGMQGNVISKTIDSSKTIFTTPQIVFNVQELDEAKLQQCFNYINRKFGSQY